MALERPTFLAVLVLAMALRPWRLLAGGALLSPLLGSLVRPQCQPQAGLQVDEDQGDDGDVRLHAADISVWGLPNASASVYRLGGSGPRNAAGQHDDEQYRHQIAQAEVPDLAQAVIQQVCRLQRFAARP